MRLQRKQDEERLQKLRREQEAERARLLAELNALKAKKVRPPACPPASYAASSPPQLATRRAPATQEGR